MKNLILAVFLLSCGTLATAARGGEPSDLAALRQKYERHADAALAPVIQGYIRELEFLSKRPQPGRTAADLDAIRAELARQKQRQAEAAQTSVLGSSADADRVNLLPNPGFEKGLDSWIVWGNDPAAAPLVKDAQDSHTGRAYIRLKKDETGDTAVLMQDLAGAVKPGDRVHAEVWVRRSPNHRGDASFGVIFKDAADKRMIQVIAWPVRATGRWERCTLDFLVPTKDQAPDLAKIQLVCLLQGKGDTGEVCIDDVFAGFVAP